MAARVLFVCFFFLFFLDNGRTFYGRCLSRGCTGRRRINPRSISAFGPMSSGEVDRPGRRARSGDYPAVLQVKIKIKIKLSVGSGPTSAQNHRFPLKDGSPDPPPDPPGEGGTRTNQKASLHTAGTTTLIDIVSTCLRRSFRNA